MQTLIHDLRYALRQLRKSPGFTAISVITLALGIGANTALFTLVNTLLLHSLPYRDADRLIYVGEFWPHEPVDHPPSPDFIAWRNRARTVDALEAYGQGSTAVFSSPAGPEQIGATDVTNGFLNLLGVRLASGRNFTPEEDRPGAAPVVILSHRFWQSRFGASPSIIGQSIALDGAPATVVGVLPASFIFPDNNFGTDVLVSMRLDPAPGWIEKNFRLLRVLARLKPGVSPETMRREFDGIVQSTAAQEPPQFITMRKGMRVTAFSLRERLAGDVRPLLLTLQAVVGMILLIACLNVANLQLGRAVARQQEIALRTSLGATRSRLAAQLLTESLVLSLAGGFAGIALGELGLRYLTAFLPQNLHLLGAVHINLNVLAFTAVLSLLAAILSGVAPVAAAYRANPNEVLKDTGRSANPGGHSRVRQALVIAQVAIAMILLTGSGLLIRSFLRLRSVDLGFDPANVLTLHVPLSGQKLSTDDQQIRFSSELLNRFQTMPGVHDAAVSGGLPVTGSTSGVGAVVEGRQAPPPGGAPDIDLTQVSASYFHALAIPLLQGRLLTEQDHEGSQPVIVINQSFAERFFPDQPVIGKHVKFGSMSKGPWYEIVGIVGNVRQQHLRTADLPNIYVPYRQNPWGDTFLVLKLAAPGIVTAAQAAKVVHSLDPDQPVDDIATMDERLSDSITSDRANMTLMGIFAACALVLAAVGIFGVMAYFVSRRTHEIGVRIALGAQRTDILRLVLASGMFMTSTGIAAGILGSFALTRFLRSSLYGIGANDPLTMLSAAAVFFAAALLACYLPARRAAKTDPMEALRYE